VSGAASASFCVASDGDGNRVKATFGSATTVYVGNYYEKEGSTVRMYKAFVRTPLRRRRTGGDAARQHPLLHPHRPRPGKRFIECMERSLLSGNLTTEGFAHLWAGWSSAPITIFRRTQILTKDQVQALRSPSLSEALSADTSRGFELASSRAAQAPAVIERLREVFGLYRTGCAPAMWDAQPGGWAFRGETGGWSEPILACAAEAWARAALPSRTARKSAVTDGPIKAASMIGVGVQEPHSRRWQRQEAAGRLHCVLGVVQDREHAG
jgi:hypothetical protein